MKTITRRPFLKTIAASFAALFVPKAAKANVTIASEPFKGNEVYAIRCYDPAMYYVAMCPPDGRKLRSGKQFWINMKTQEAWVLKDKQWHLLEARWNRSGVLRYVSRDLRTSEEQQAADKQFQKYFGEESIKPEPNAWPYLGNYQ